MFIYKYMGEMRNVYKILVRKSEGKQQLRKPKHRWEDNIRIDLRKRGWADVNQIHLGEDRDQ
jgi:hypothetical protein